jgi:hypothetical protein
MFQCVNESQPIHLYLPHGDLNGLATASTGDGSVKVYRVPRSMLHDYELGVGPKDNGVFFLVGGEADGSPHCYMASGHDLPSRIVARDVETSHWQTAYYAVSGSTPWTQTEAGYIGSHCAAKAAESGRYALYGPATGIQSTPAPELAARCAKQADSIASLMKTLGCDVLGQASASHTDDDLFYLKQRQSEARGRVSKDGSITVLAGSSGPEEPARSTANATLKYRKRLISSGLASISGGRFELLSDHEFGKLSTAAAVITGSSINGYIHWKTSSGLTSRQYWAAAHSEAA